MPLEIGQSCTWNDRVAKGAAAQLAVLSATYTCSHGATPGTFLLTVCPEIDPATGLPLAPFVGATGDLVFTDGVHGEVRVRDCYITKIDSGVDDSGTTLYITGVDRRWRWQSQTYRQGFGGAVGRFNATDARGKLVPWTIRSPQEVAAFLLAEAGEQNYNVTLPPGLPATAGADLNRYLIAGENFPYTVTNPEVCYDYTPPMLALAAFAEDLGCRLVYDPITDRVIIGPLGVGADLPDDLPYESINLGVKSPELPGFIGVYGPPVRYEARLKLFACAREGFDTESGTLVPVDLASYTPLSNGQVQVSTLAPKDGQEPSGLFVQLDWQVPGGTNQSLSRVVNLAGQSYNPTALMAGVVAQLLADPRVPPVFEVRADTATATLTVAGKVSGMFFTLRGWLPAETGDTSEAWAWATTQQARPVGTTWAFSSPRSFPWVRASASVPYEVAKSLAAESVWRIYRPRVTPGMTIADVEVVRIQQIVLQGSRVAQVTPQPRHSGGINKGSLIVGDDVGNPFDIPQNGVLPEFYNGYSRDRDPVVYGSVSKSLTGGRIIWVPDPDLNTPEGSRVYVPFSVRPDEQAIVFSSPVYRDGFAPGDTGAHGWYQEPELELLTGMLLIDKDTNLPRRWRKVVPLTGSGVTEWHEHPDLQVGILVGAETPGEPGARSVRWTKPSLDAAYGIRLTVSWTRGGVASSVVLRTDATPAALAAQWATLQDELAADAAAATALQITTTYDTLTVTARENFPITAMTAEFPSQTDPPGDFAAAYVVSVVRPGREDVIGQGWRYAPGDFEHATAAADFYLEGHARRYRLSRADSRQYVGIHAIPLDCKRQQVTWSVGPGATTTASTNAEHSTVVPPFPARRYRENLPPDRAAALANLYERRIVDNMPKTPGAVR